MKRKSLLFSLLLLFVLLFASVMPLLAQDATAVPTEESTGGMDEGPGDDDALGDETPGANLTDETTPEVVTATPQATPIVIIVTQPAGGSGGTGGTGNSGSSDPIYPIVLVVIVGLFALSAVDRWQNYKLSKAAISQIPAEWLPVIMQGLQTAQRQLYERAGVLVSGTSGVWDDNLLNEEMKRAGWEFYIDPTTGEQHARKITALPQPPPAPSAPQLITD